MNLVTAQVEHSKPPPLPFLKGNNLAHKDTNVLANASIRWRSPITIPAELLHIITAYYYKLLHIQVTAEYNELPIQPIPVQEHQYPCNKLLSRADVMSFMQAVKLANLMMKQIKQQERQQQQNVAHIHPCDSAANLPVDFG